MPASLNFELHTGPGGRAASDARRAAGAQPARLLLLGDFGGRGSGGAATVEPGSAAGRWSGKTRVVDIDNLDAVMRLMAPRLHLQVQGRTCEFAPQSLDDFHPDQLLHSLPPLQQGLARLQALRDPAQFARAAAEWDSLGGASQQTAPALQAAQAPLATAAAPAADDLLSSLLGGQVRRAAAALAPARSGIDALLQSAVAGQVLPAAPAHQPAYVAAAQAALADDLRAVLHDPAFQTLEAAWRAVQLLVSKLELGETLELHLADAALPDLLADLVAAQGRVETTATARLFTGNERGPGVIDEARHIPRWSAVFGLFGFSDSVQDLGLLAAVGTAAARAQTPFVAMASAELVQAALAAGGDTTAARQRWDTLRRSEVAPWVGLVGSPLLLRLPYDKRHNPVQPFDFEELTGAAEPAPLLWGSGAVAAAALLGQACAEASAEVGTGQQTLDDLPAWVRRDEDGESELQACAGQFLSEAESEQLLVAGLMPLWSHRRKSAVTLPRWQSTAEPLQALRGLPMG